jgi:hypothetical protein
MIRLIILFVVLLPFVSFGHSDLPLGVGVISVDFQKSPKLMFYQDTIVSSTPKVISIGRDKEGEYILRNEKQAGWFKPEQFSLEYDIFIIRVDTVVGSWYRVIVNSEKGTLMWTKKSSEKRFMEWPRFLLNETTAIDAGPVDIKNAPGTGTKTIRPATKKDCFEVLEIRGDWMRIRTNTKLDCDESGKPIKSGWIKWRDHGKLMIEYFLTC